MVNEYRCPKCGSQEVRVDFKRSVFENKWMTCNACSYGSFITWQDEDEWLVVHQDAAAVAANAPAVCTDCTSDDATIAYHALEAVHVTTFVLEVHFGIDIKQCKCGRQAAGLFSERVGHGDDGDSQTWLMVPLPDDLQTVLVDLAGERRYLVRSNWNPVPWWVDGGFSIPPHH